MAIENENGRWIKLAYFLDESNDVANLITNQTSLLNALTEEVRKMALNLDTLTAEVGRLETVNGSAVTLLHTLLNEIHDLKDDPAALEALVGRVRVATDALAAAVAASTPAAPVEPAPIVVPPEVVLATPEEVAVQPIDTPIVAEPAPVVVEEPVVVDAPVDAPVVTDPPVE